MDPREYLKESERQRKQQLAEWRAILERDAQDEWKHGDPVRAGRLKLGANKAALIQRKVYAKTVDGFSDYMGDLADVLEALNIKGAKGLR